LNSQFNVAAPSNSELSISPEVFSPDNDGYQDVALISYSLDLPGYTGTITVYDDLGRKVRILARNELLGTEGSFTWNGFDDDNQKAGVGIYVIVAELFDPEGNTELLKLPCVLAHRLN
jgi:flagellar hook assembly protein FlgD